MKDFLVKRYVLHVNSILYRYNLDCPPSKWDNDYKSIEYTYNDMFEALQTKNSVGAFFFFDNLETACSLGTQAALEKDLNKIWLTQTQTISEISLLDISKSNNISSILLVFDDMDIDVLCDNFFKFDPVGPCKSFRKIKNTFDQFKKLVNKENKTNNDCCEISSLAYEIGAFFYDNERVDYFGQLLTDFSNGKSFKEVLQSKGYDGYMFREVEGSPTYCIFESTYLTKPNHKEQLI